MKKWKMILLMVLISGFLTLPAFSAEDTGVSDEKVLPEASASEEVPKTSASENMQSPAVHQQALMEEANSLLKSQEVDKIKQAIPIYEKILKNDPDNYEATWRCAKAYRDYGHRSRLKELSGWEDTCAKYGKKGMKRAKKAIKLNPERAWSQAVNPPSGLRFRQWFSGPPRSGPGSRLWLPQHRLRCVYRCPAISRPHRCYPALCKAPVRPSEPCLAPAGARHHRPCN